MRKFIKLFVAYILLYISYIGHSFAIDLSVGQGRVAAKPIAVMPFLNDVNNKIDFIISADLKQSGVFAPISPDSYRGRLGNTNEIDYSIFQSLGVAYVVTGELYYQSIRFIIRDAFQKKIIGSYSIDIAPKTVRQSAHEISDIILEKLTGTRGAFATKLVYVYESGKGENKRFQIVVSDSDGANPKVLLTTLAPIMSPRFSPDGKNLAYVTFEGQRSQIVTHNIKSGTRKLVSKERGINSSPAWSPDGSKIAMVLSRDGNPEIYFKDLYSGNLVRLTTSSSIDSEPVWSADGRYIYFTSDRSGFPQLYRISISTRSVKELTMKGKYSAGADISADGSRMALVRNVNGRFIVGVANLDTNIFNPVSNGFSDETPHFSPNGKMLIFTSVKNGKEVLKIVNVDGGGGNILSTSGNIRDPDWSSYIK